MSRNQVTIAFARKTLAAAVAAMAIGAPALAQTTPTVYGQANLSADNINDGANSGSYVSSNSSRVGVKGTGDLGGGLKAVYQYEAGVNINNGAGSSQTMFQTRDSFLGLSGSFGTVSIGRVGFLNQAIYDANLFADQVGDLGNFFAAIGTGAGRMDRSIKYDSPSFSGFQVSGTYVAANSTTTGQKDASEVLRATYGSGPLNLGLTYTSEAKNDLATPGAPNAKSTTLAGTYNFGTVLVGAGYVKGKDVTFTSGADVSVWSVGAGFTVGNGMIKAQYTSRGNVANIASTDAKMIAVGYDYNLNSNATLYATYASVTNGDGNVAVVQAYDWGHGVSVPVNAAANQNDPKALSFGMVYKF
jgi:predicted porin